MQVSFAPRLRQSAGLKRLCRPSSSDGSSSDASSARRGLDIRTLKAWTVGSGAQNATYPLSVPGPRRITPRTVSGAQRGSTGILRRATKLPLRATARKGPRSPHVGRYLKAERFSNVLEHGDRRVDDVDTESELTRFARRDRGALAR